MCVLCIYVCYVCMHTVYCASVNLQRLEVDKEDMLLSESQVGVCVREVVQKMNTRYLSRRPPNSWYWKILVMACQQFRPSPHSFDLEWCRDASFTLSVLTETYRVCKHSSLLRTPPLVRECTQSDEDLLNNVRDYFEWFEEIQRFVQQWCDKVKSGDLTRREVEQYVLFSEELTKIAEQVQVDSKRLCDSKSLSEKVAELSRKVEDLLVRQTSNQQRYVCILYVLCVLYSMYCMYCMYCMYSMCALYVQYVRIHPQCSPCLLDFVD